MIFAPNNLPKTAAACSVVHDLLEQGFDRQAHGIKRKTLVLGWAALCGLISEPESAILLGRAGELRRFAKQGYLVQVDLPPGLKGAPHFPHAHHFHLTEKGQLFVAHHVPHLSQYGNRPIQQRTYLHDFIARIEAAWRIRVLQYVGYIPEARLPDLAHQFQKQHDGHLLTFGGLRVGLEVEAADWKSGDKLARFVAQCFNSIINQRVQGVLVLVQNEAARKHYAKPFQAGQTYCSEWVKRAGKWEARQSSQTEVTPGMAAKVRVELIRTKQQIEHELIPPVPVWMPSITSQLETPAK